jgi:hypothetical protein
MLPLGRRPWRPKRPCRNRPFERWCVVHAVAGHTDDVPAPLQSVDDMIFMFGEAWAKPSAPSIDLASSSVAFLVVSSNVWASRTLVPRPESPRPLLSDSHLIAGDHFYVDAHLLGTREGGLGRRPGRIEHRQAAHPRTARSCFVGFRDAQRTESADGEAVDRFVAADFATAALRDICRMTRGAPLATSNCLPSAPLTVASVRL